MTQQEIIEMARQAGLMAPKGDKGPWLWGYRDVEAFAKLAVEKEREACAEEFDKRNNGVGFYEPHEPAEIIRARGQA